MIDQTSMWEPVLRAHPGFTTQWEAFMEEWANHPRGTPHFLLVGDLVIECTRLLQAGEDETIAAIFAAVERWIEEGDKYVLHAATTGFVEDMQNTNLHQGTAPEDFERFLQPQSKIWWGKLNRFWQHGERLIDDRQT